MILAVYGTLRKGGRLQRYLGDATLLSTERLNGYDMYSLGSYPYVTEGEGSVLVEVYEVPTKEAFRTANMEMNAGYDVVPVSTSVGVAYLFVYNPDYHKWPKVTDGDWLLYDSIQRKPAFS